MPTSSHDQHVFIGIDVQLSRGLAYAVMSAGGRVIDNGWAETSEPNHVVDTLLSRHPTGIFGIDAPRQTMPAPREHYWSGGGWRSRRPGDRGFGRHCEVVISACGLARPQWTPTTAQEPAGWMALGFALFSACERLGSGAEEVFPSASYKQLDESGDATIELPLSHFHQGPKDMLDAVIAAFSLREYVVGNGTAVGGGDGLGKIVLPRPVEHPSFAAVSEWPG